MRLPRRIGTAGRARHVGCQRARFQIQVLQQLQQRHLPARHVRQPPLAFPAPHGLVRHAQQLPQILVVEVPEQEFQQSRGILLVFHLQDERTHLQTHWHRLTGMLTGLPGMKGRPLAIMKLEK